LFEQLIRDNALSGFVYIDLLRKMIDKDPEKRIESFSAVSEYMLGKNVIIDNFDENEKEVYRNFADSLINAISKIEKNTTYFELSSCLPKLEDTYQKNMLEEYVQNIVDVTRAFINGTYYTTRNRKIFVYELKAFIDLFKKSDKEKQRIILLNLYNRLDRIERYTNAPDEFTDDIPF
jgi:serine/threonine-protein kinase